MEFQNEPLEPPPSEFLRSAAMFIVTMGTVFGMGLVWTNYSDQIVAKWNKDWNGMKESWAAKTSPQKRKPDLGILGALPGTTWGRDGFGYEMKPADNSQLRSRRPVVPMIDTSRPLNSTPKQSGR